MEWRGERNDKLVASEDEYEDRRRGGKKNGKTKTLESKRAQGVDGGESRGCRREVSHGVRREREEERRKRGREEERKRERTIW